jgi:hypothetical protein
MVDATDELLYYREWQKLVRTSVVLKPAKVAGSWRCEILGAKYDVTGKKIKKGKGVGEADTKAGAEMALFRKVSGRVVNFLDGRKFNTPVYMKSMAFNRSKGESI